MTATEPAVRRLRRLPRAAMLSLVPLAACAALAAAGEPPPIAWDARFDGAGEPFATDVLTDLAVNAAGEVCATGTSVVSGGASAAATVFYDSDGTERWRHRYVAPETGGNEEGLRVALDDAGRCRVAGRRSLTSPPGTGPDVLVLEYSPQGDLVWSATHDGPGAGFDAGVDVAADPAGNVYVLALAAGAGTGWDLVTLKYDAAGNELWARGYDGPAGGDDRPAGIAVDADGYVYVAGTAAVTSQLGDDFVVIKYDPDGNELWTELVDGGVVGTDVAAGLALDAAGHPYVAGRMLLPPGTEWQAAVVKLNPEGAVEWIGSAGHPSTGIPEDVHGLAVAGDGSSTLVATGSDDVIVARFDPAGALVWDHLHDGVSIASVAGRPLAVDGAGNAYVAAVDFLAGRGYDFLSYRLEAADGAVGWVATYGEPGETADDFAAAAAVDPRGRLVVGGSVRPSGTTFETDWAVVAYAGVLFADGFESGDLSGWSASSGG